MLITSNFLMTFIYLTLDSQSYFDIFGITDFNKVGGALDDRWTKCQWIGDM